MKEEPKTANFDESLVIVNLLLDMDEDRIADEDEEEQNPQEKENLLHFREVVRRVETQAKQIESLQAIVDRLPKTSDGVPFFIGDTVFIPNDDREYFGPEPILEVKVNYVSGGASFVEYRGDFTIGTDGDIEGGNLDFYSSRDACPNRDE